MYHDYQQVSNRNRATARLRISNPLPVAVPDTTSPEAVSHLL